MFVKAYGEPGVGAARSVGTLLRYAVPLAVNKAPETSPDGG